jgi:hypothetical protein
MMAFWNSNDPPSASPELTPLERDEILQMAAGTVSEVRDLIQRFDSYPDIDLFKEYP